VNVLLQALRKVSRLYRAKRDPVGFARSLGVHVGERCRFIQTSDETFGSEPFLIRIGDHVTITAGVQFVTHDGGVWVFREREPAIDVVAPIVVGNNVFIGLNAIILAGVTIGDDCVIGAGAVVARDIPAGTVAAGVPAKPLKTVEAYRESLAGRATDIRSLAPGDKRRVLEERFAARLGRR
jgi:acetyltransferase-like isoleucine patch superfamily enzyme